MHLKREVSESFTTCWLLCEEESSCGAGGDKQNDDKQADFPAPYPAPAPAADPSPSLPNNRGNKAGAKKRVRSSLEMAISDASEVKRKMASTLSSSAALVASVKADPDWAWANNDTNLAEITKARNEVQESIGSVGSFGRKYTSMEVRDLKKEMQSSQLCSELVKFASDLGGPVHELHVACSSLLAMHRARMAARGSSSA